MSVKNWLGIDCGSAYVRVALATAANDPVAVVPRLVQFDGEPALRNMLYLTPEQSAIQEIGDEVLRLDPAVIDITRLRWSAALTADPQHEAGQAAGLLLAHVVETLQRDHGWQPGSPDTTVLIAVNPVGSGPVSNTAAVATKLRNSSLAQADNWVEMDSALAALAQATNGRPAPGRYGVVDLGAARTRFALIECTPDKPPVTTQRFQSGPSGTEFDAALQGYFEALLPSPAEDVVDLARTATIEAFKRAFVDAWNDGQTSYTAVVSHNALSVTLTLDCTTFTSAAVAGGLIAEFKAAADNFFRRHAPDGDLTQMILVGGGAHWPFVYEWATRNVGKERVWRDAFPERAIVLGLPRLAALQLAASSMERVPSPGPIPGGAGVRPRRPATAKAARLSAGPAALVEFVGGLFGVLGLGWFGVAGRLGVGCPALLSWWVVLALLIALGVASAVTDRPALLIPLLIFWVTVPALSAAMLYRSLRRASPS